MLVFEATDDLGADTSSASHPGLNTTTDARGHTVVRLALPPDGPEMSFIRCRVDPK